jgi:hypothetical protein
MDSTIQGGMLIAYYSNYPLKLREILPNNQPWAGSNVEREKVTI